MFDYMGLCLTPKVRRGLGGYEYMCCLTRVRWRVSDSLATCITHVILNQLVINGSTAKESRFNGDRATLRLGNHERDAHSRDILGAVAVF
jgi:hypothetical protein